ncbi:hypothetical protein B0H16DRAFT_1745999 [Mycena metata]|uniref:Uncharacterized protein n=1 Tax=Mycena metata TaxID=1033252 RepID=A0AAD7H0P0_9AGAR|nr:hypothetical protein B0H16DRAFT_1745999 [Mycena metata]
MAGFAVCWETWGTLDLFDQLMIFGPAVVFYGHFDVAQPSAKVSCSKQYQIYSGRRPVPFPATERRIYDLANIPLLLPVFKSPRGIYPKLVIHPAEALKSRVREYTRTIYPILSTLLKSVVREYTCTLYPNLVRNIFYILYSFLTSFPLSLNSARRLLVEIVEWALYPQNIPAATPVARGRLFLEFRVRLPRYACMNVTIESIIRGLSNEPVSPSHV